MKLGLSQFITQQLTPPAPVVQADLKGKTVIITGANNGIGYEATKHFARMKPGKLILACRSEERGVGALEKLKEETSCDTAELWLLDLAKFDSVRSFAQRFEREGGRLDILVENAGILPESKYAITDDGWEPCFQVNYLSSSLLFLLLLPRMIKTAVEHRTRPRLVIVSSDVHYWATIPDQLLAAHRPLRFYGSQDNFSIINKTQVHVCRMTPQQLISFLLSVINVFFIRALNERLQTTYLIANAVNPGYCYSHIRSTFPWYKALVDWVMEKALARTAEEGSRNLVWAAVGGKEQEDKLRGAYISMTQVVEPSDYVIDEEGQGVQDLLWDDLIKELSKIEPEVRVIVQKYLTAAMDSKEELVSPLTLSAFANI
ncbi:hypothetical protein CVT26_002337 [Gymnopilus dilepis]|uniref:NAD(P)-binding protein n=1 Tax=Gymnopilus dilepis TaxID=231916 RepID=A0A409Y3I9_9AGAR|nr:hypothetical protein CVT26_002337 [Gymnopilus dilepis]